MTTECLKAWAGEKVAELKRHAEYRGRQVDEDMRLRGNYNFIVARDAMSAACVAQRIEWCLHVEETTGNPECLQCEWDRYHDRDTEAQRVRSRPCDRSQAPMAAGEPGT